MMTCEPDKHRWSFVNCDPGKRVWRCENCGETMVQYTDLNGG